MASNSYLHLTAAQKFPIGIRRNNPGNLRGKKGLYPGETAKPGGDTKEGQTYYAFVDMAHGLAAMARLAMSRIVTGSNTIRKLQRKYSVPTSEKQRAEWIAKVAKNSGFGADQALSTDKASIHKLCWGLIKTESGLVFNRGGITARITDEDFEDAWDIISNPPLA